MVTYFKLPESEIAVTERSANDFDADFTRFRRGNDHFLYHQRLLRFASHRRCRCIHHNEDMVELIIGVRLNAWQFTSAFDGLPCSFCGFNAIASAIHVKDTGAGVERGEMEILMSQAISRI